MLIKLKKGKELVATADTMSQRCPLDGQYVETLFFFPKVSLTPPCMFIHLSGTGLMAFLDNCRLIEGNEANKRKVDGLRYVHGRSEALKGETEITSVLLAKPREGIHPQLWLEQVPKIYEEFLKTFK